MIYESIDLYRYFGVQRTQGEGGKITVYNREKLGDLVKKVRPAALVIPGGGYGMVSGREGEPIALRFVGKGYAAFLLEYSVNVAYPVPLKEAAMAMVYIRENAEKYGIDPERVAAIGFSAGGHLAGMLATLFGEACLRETLGERAKLVRPDAVVLSYPVITTREELTHGTSAATISGGDAALRRALSLETRVTADSSPAFLWHTAEDELVPVANSLLYANACLQNGVPFELHVFEKGWHGTSEISIETTDEEALGRIRHLSAWMDLAFTWLQQRGFCVR